VLPWAPGSAQALRQRAELPGGPLALHSEPVSAQAEPSALLSEAAAVAYGPAVPQWAGEAEACEPEVPPSVAAGVVVLAVQARRPEAASVSDVREPPSAEATAGSDAQAQPQEAVTAAACGPAAWPRAAVSGARELQPVAASAHAVLQPAAGAARPDVPAVVPVPAWPAVRLAPSFPLPSLARRRAAQSARAMLKLRTALPSARSLQAARDEALSCI
jgi:hypothetical protein